MKRIKLLIHHHAPVFLHGGSIYIQSFIGIWVEELSQYFDTIGLLVNVTSNKIPEQDYIINATNVKIYQLNKFPTTSRVKRNKKIKSVCKEVYGLFDVLLIRGITPKQWLIFKNCKIRYRFFLLVGSLIDSQPVIEFTKSAFLTWLLYWYRRYELRKIAKSCTMLANSPAVVKEISEIYGVQAAFIPTNTIKKTDFIPFEIRLPGNPLRLLFCSRVVKDKGIEEAFEAINILKNSETDVIIDVVGNCAKRYRKFLYEKISSLKIDGQVVFHGFIPFGGELLRFFRNADIYLLPSWHEGFPHSVWEAAISCTPIIITSVGGVQGILSSDNVLFCEVKNAVSIAEKVKNCVTDIEATRNRVISLYNLAADYTLEKCAAITYNIVSEPFKQYDEN